MSPADSIPSQCMSCSGPYYRQGELDVYIMSYFCDFCRVMLSKDQWELMQRFYYIILDLENNECFWDTIYKLNIDSADFQLARGTTLRILFNGFKNHLSREDIFSVFQALKISELFHSKILDLIELFEEYDRIKETHNG